MLALLRVAGHALTGGARRSQLLRAIEGHFWRHLGYDTKPVFPGDPVTFADDSVPITAPMDFALLCEKLESLELAKPSSKSFAVKNFAYLKNGLNLSQCETKFLIWSYCHEQSRPSPLPDIQFDAIADRNTFVALMLDEDEGTVSHYFAIRRLCSLRLLETSPMSSLDRTQVAGTLRSFLAGSDHFINLVELGHGNQEAILTHLLSAELDAFLDPELLPDEVLEVLSPPFRRLYVVVK